MSQPRPEIRLTPQVGVGGGGGMRVPQGVKGAQDTRTTLTRLWGYLRRQHSYLGLVVVLVVSATLCTLALPYLVGTAIDRFIAVGNLDGLARLVMVMGGIAVIYALSTWGFTLLMNRVSQYTVRDLRRDMFARLQTLPLRFFDQRPHGELMSYLTNDVENISGVLADNVTIFLSSLLIIIGMVVMMLAINLPLAMVSLVVLPLTAFFTRYVAKRTRQGFRDQQEALALLNGHIEETITGGKVLRAFGREQAVIDEFVARNEQLRNAAIHAQIYGGLMGPGSNMIYNFGFVLIASAGGWLALHDVVTVGIIATFLTYTQQIRRPINDLANMFNAIQSALAGAERVFSIMDERPETDATEHAVALPQARGEVIFKDVSFGYLPGVPTLKHINLKVEPGQMIALVGPTGAGKTTIVNLLSRFYEIDSGQILLDGHPLNTLDKYDLRRRLGIVLQDTFLFSETVMENIRYGRLDASDEEVITAARLANADHFISRLPHGYQQMLSERAENLSQGQRQLLAIARAILANPAILILDEATSSVDTRTEIQVQDAMRHLMQGRTSFVIAHRLSTIRNANLILFIRNGEIVERGTHAELLARRRDYYHLFMSQFKAASSISA